MRGKASAGKCRQVQASCTQRQDKTWGHADAQTQLNLYVRLPYAVALALGIKNLLTEIPKRRREIIQTHTVRVKYSVLAVNTQRC